MFLKDLQIPPRGLEPEHVSSLNNNDLQKIKNSTGAESGAFSVKTSKIDSDLWNLINFWPSLPEHIKAAIKALVQTYHKQGGLQ